MIAADRYTGASLLISSPLTQRTQHSMEHAHLHAPNIQSRISFHATRTHTATEAAHGNDTKVSAMNGQATNTLFLLLVLPSFSTTVRTINLQRRQNPGALRCRQTLPGAGFRRLSRPGGPGSALLRREREGARRRGGWNRGYPERVQVRVRARPRRGPRDVDFRAVPLRTLRERLHTRGVRCFMYIGM